jgi:hypothetical protein
MTKMKIALLIAGTTRNYLENYPTWKTCLLDLFDTDIFFHTYNIMGYQNNTKNNIGNNVEPIFDNDFNEKLLLDILKPKSYKIDDFKIKLEYFKTTIPSQLIYTSLAYPEYIKSQFYSIEQAYKLCEEYQKNNNIIYDVVVKIRFDTIFIDKFLESDFKLVIDSKILLCGNPGITKMAIKNGCTLCIELSNNNKKPTRCQKHTFVSDIVMIGNLKNIKSYCEIYKHYDRYLEKYADIISATQEDLNNDSVIKTKYPNGNIVYKVPLQYIQKYNVQIYFPELIIGEHLYKCILLNYQNKVDTNRNKI